MKWGNNMDHIIEMNYDSASKKTAISSNGINFDTERLNGIDISKWIYPFHINGVIWYGLYEELKSVYQHNTYTIIFDGKTEDYEILKNAMKDKHIEVKEKISKVIVLYDGSNFMTKITINGKIFDTQRIEKRSIDEWVKPFAFKAASWDGIFGEIEKYIGNDFYSISFVGNQEDMKILMENAPNNISIFYKPQVLPQKKVQQSVEATSNIVKNTITNTSKLDNGYQEESSTSILKDNDTDQNPTKFELKNLSLNKIKLYIMELIKGAKNDYHEMNRCDSGLLTFGKVAVVIALICCVLFTIYSFRLMVILCALPSMIFCFLAYTKGYKKISICTFIVCFLIAFIGWLIITIRLHIIMNEIDDAFKDIADSWEKDAEDFKDIFSGQSK